jgi:hypothetical protein
MYTAFPKVLVLLIKRLGSSLTSLLYSTRLWLYVHISYSMKTSRRVPHILRHTVTQGQANDF